MADGLIKYLNEEVIKMKVSLNQDVSSTLYPLTYLSALTFTSSLRATYSVDHVWKWKRHSGMEDKFEENYYVVNSVVVQPFR